MYIWVIACYMYQDTVYCLQLIFAGYKGHHPPTDDAGFLDYARNLPSPTIHNAIAKATPVSPILSYSKTGNFRRLFEKQPPPEGLCVIGDAVCHFNPINVSCCIAPTGSQLQVPVHKLQSWP